MPFQPLLDPEVQSLAQKGVHGLAQDQPLDVLPLEQVRAVLALNGVLDDVVEVGEDAGDARGVVPGAVPNL